MGKLSWLVCVLGLFARISGADLQFGYDTTSKTWTLSNDVATAQFDLSSVGQFRFRSFGLRDRTVVWTADAARLSSPIKFTLDKTAFGGSTRWTLLSQKPLCATTSCTQLIRLRDSTKVVDVELAITMYRGQPVLRHEITVTNLKSTTAFMTVADMAPYSFTEPAANTFKIFRVNQWAVAPKQLDFETFQNTLSPTGGAVNVLSGAHGVQCSWFALQDQNGRGLFAGWEFDGLATGSARQIGSGNYLQFGAAIADLHHPVESNATFQIPGAFIGLFGGDWDEAGYRTQQFVEQVLAKPMPDKRFPFVVWDSWAYKTDLNDDTLRREADQAAALGIELFIVDLGWAKAIGDWNEDPAKFPGGLRDLSDYVHSLGMKFGLHFAFAEASEQSPVLQDHPDWTSTENDNYFGALSLCLSNRPARDWVVAEGVRIIDAYNVDWILQDGENMVKRCIKTTHTHDAGDSNYSNAVDGVNAVIAEIQRQRPNVLWENCENGGNMMTFNMVKSYVTSITNDASGALASRQAVWGATYPFPTRYTDRYQPEDFLNTYVTRSYMFGGPWHLMTKLVGMPPEQFQLAQGEIAIYKQIRATIRQGKVFHLTSPAQAQVADAIQTYSAEQGYAIAVVCRDAADPDHGVVKLRGLDAEKNYQVTFANDTRILIMTGAQLMQSGVMVLHGPQLSGEIVHARSLPLTATQ